MAVAISIDKSKKFATTNSSNVERYGLIFPYVGLIASIYVYHRAQYALVRNADSFSYAAYLLAFIVDEFAFGSGFGCSFV